MNRTYEYLIGLIRSVIKGERSPVCDDNVDMKRLARLCEMHHIVPIIYPKLVKNDRFCQSDAGRRMNAVYMGCLAKSATQEIESERIIEAYEATEIKHIPLKGYIIKNMYPSPEMRESTDFDVYVPSELHLRACDVMAGLGYSYNEASVGLGMHDNYHLGKFMEVEVHKSLMAPDFPRWCKLCEELVDNAVPCEGYNYRYEFSKEDYYLYMQLHTIKHLKYSSCGIKPIVDIWVYLSHYEKELNWDYINRMLNKGGIREIDKNLRMLSSWWFNEIEPENPVIYQLSEYIIDSGAFGTMEQYLSGRKTGETKFGRLWRVFFLPLDEMQIKYPILKKTPVLLPLFWTHRAVYAALFKREVSANLINKGEEVSSEQAENLSEFKRSIGL